MATTEDTGRKTIAKSRDGVRAAQPTGMAVTRGTSASTMSQMSQTRPAIRSTYGGPLLGHGGK